MSIIISQELVDLFSEEAKGSKICELLGHILESIREISEGLRSGIFSHDTIGTQNQFGDHQLDVDVKSDEVIFRHLTSSKLVSVASSEENPIELPCNGVGFSVAFDPLDGSSIIDANFAVGTIIGVWPGSRLLNRYGRDLAISLIAQYGT